MLLTAMIVLGRLLHGFAITLLACGEFWGRGGHDVWYGMRDGQKLRLESTSGSTNRCGVGLTRVQHLGLYKLSREV
jgi:hypothetical protein